MGAPGSTHDAKMLRNSTVFQKIVTGHAIAERVIDLEEHGKILLVTVGDTAFRKHAWLIKVFREETSGRREKYFNKKLWHVKRNANVKGCIWHVKRAFPYIVQKDRMPIV